MTPRTRPDALAALQALTATDESTFDLTAVAITCALHDDPERSVAEALTVLEQLAEAAVGSSAMSLDALTALIHGTMRFSGDSQTYDDLSNADMIHVLRQRKGLPVSLGVIYRHVAKAAGLELHGIDMPGHFLMRLDGVAGPVFIDPFRGGMRLGEADLTRLAEAAGHPALSPTMVEPVSDRRIALRLQNNIWSRARQAGDWVRAERAAQRRALLLNAPQLQVDHAEALIALGAYKGARHALQQARQATTSGVIDARITALDALCRTALH